MILNGAYLVPVEAGAPFASVVAEVGAGHPGVQVEVGGPWPPYSFAVLD
jgi:hypothetical protein